MAVAAYLRITKGMQRKTKEIVVWWKTGLGNWESSPLLSRTLLAYFRGVVQINLESLCPRLGRRNLVVLVLEQCINLRDS
jgi:hypothetical protein